MYHTQRRKPILPHFVTKVLFDDEGQIVGMRLARRDLSKIIKVGHMKGVDYTKFAKANFVDGRMTTYPYYSVNKEQPRRRSSRKKPRHLLCTQRILTIET